VVAKLTQGLGELCRQRGVTFIQGRARFRDAHTAIVDTPDGGHRTLAFEHAILATGSVPSTLPFIPASPRVMDSTSALALADIPRRLLVLGAGYIGMELGQVYAALGARVSVAEFKPSILPGVDPQLVKPLSARVAGQFEKVMLATRVTNVSETSAGLEVTFEGPDGRVFEGTYDKLLVAVGRRPVTQDLGLETTQVKVGADGFVGVDAHLRTAEPSIFAIGDIVGQPMLAHKATHEGLSAVESLTTTGPAYAPRAIPAVVFTDPEIAWCGLTEDEARRQGLDVKVGTFPWQASGRAATLDRPDGVTKLVTEAATGRILGVGVGGHAAGELIGEGVLAIEMGAVADDLALTVHAHPSLSETLMEAAQRVMGQSTHFFKRS
jgi:dihydrolipoamide dehydrogenase